MVALATAYSWFVTLEEDNTGKNTKIESQYRSFGKSPVPSIFEEPTKAISLVLPAFNEEERLGPCLEQTLEYALDRFLCPAFLQTFAMPFIFSYPVLLINTKMVHYRYLQTRRDREGPAFTYEVIIVDDGSSDATCRFAQSLYLCNFIQLGHRMLFGPRQLIHTVGTQGCFRVYFETWARCCAVG